MTQVVIENPILNSAFAALTTKKDKAGHPALHQQFDGLVNFDQQIELYQYSCNLDAQSPSAYARINQNDSFSWS